MKRLLSVALVLILALSALTACGETPTQNDPTSTTPTTTRETTTKSTTTENITSAPALNIPQLTEYSYIYTVPNSGGYKVKISYHIGRWIRANETQLLQAVWKDVGGEGDLPIKNGMNYFANNGMNLLFDFSDAAFAFGTIDIQNATAGFSIDSNSNVIVNPFLNVNYNSASFKMATALSFSSSLTKVYLLDGVYRLQMWDITTQKMTSNSLGPMPIVIGISGTATPDYPAKINEYVSDIVFSQNEMSFTIDKNW